MNLSELAPARGALQAARVVAWRQGVAIEGDDCLAEERPVAMVYNGISHAVMLATPVDLEDFAIGFALTEGIVRHAGEVYGIEVVEQAEGIELQLHVAAACEQRLKARRRQLAGRTGCGLCGTESLAQVRRALPQAPRFETSTAVVARALQSLLPQQRLQHATGAMHAAAWCGPEGQARWVREDLGRHNALDKLTGALVREQVAAEQGFVCVTSRASFEMVQKAVAAGVGLLVAVSAPTRLAVDTARSAGLVLVGFARGNDLVAYTFPERLGLKAQAAAPFHVES